jgi:steroid delta-isomerase
VIKNVIEQQQAEAVIREYFRAEGAHDRAAWFALFSPDIVFEDPVGSRTFTGFEELGRFWDGVSGKEIRGATTAPVIVCGNEAIAIIRCEIGPVDAPIIVEPIVSNYVFDDDGKIVRMRAFYSK